MGSFSSTEAAASSPQIMPRRVEVSESLLKPPREWNLIFEFFPGHLNIWQSIFENLDSRDLLSFLLASKTAQDKVLDFVGHYVLSHERLDNLRRIMAEYPLLLQEKALRLKFQKLEQHPEFRPNLIYFKAVKSFCDKEMIIRRPVYKADNFPHLGNPSYIVKTFDETLDRDVVELKSVCWLQFVMHFEDMNPGDYQVALRIQLKPNWNLHREGEYFTAFHVTEEQEVKVGKNKSKVVVNELQRADISGTMWEKMKMREIKEVNEKLLNAEVKLDDFGTGSSYFWLVLGPFHLKEKKKFTVEFLDTQNPYWKTGMLWDFLQIKRL